jgi:hypothetical protein
MLIGQSIVGIVRPVAHPPAHRQFSQLPLVVSGPTRRAAHTGPVNMIDGLG